MAKKTSATVGLNFSNMSEEAFDSFRMAQELFSKKALAENEYTKARKELVSQGITDKKVLNSMLQRERNARTEARNKAESYSSAIISRYMDTSDFVSGDTFHFDVIPFLRNIGVLSGELDDLKKSQVKKVETLRNAVLDRIINSPARMKSGSAFVTQDDARALANTHREIVGALILAFVESKCFDFDRGSLVRVDFSAEK